MKALRVLSVAVASGKAGFCFLVDGQLRDWGIAVKAARSNTELAGFIQELINEHNPTIVVFEKCGRSCRKGERTRTLIRSVAETASHNYVLDVAVCRSKAYQTKFDEAQALAARFPEIAGYRPRARRRSFDPEPRSMIVFEALSLACSIIDGSSEQLAAAMG